MRVSAAVFHLLYSSDYRLYSGQSRSLRKLFRKNHTLTDCGVANFLLTRCMPVQFGANNQAAAMLLENAVLQDSISRVESINAVHCYRSSNRVSSELDFVVQHTGKVFPIEVKSSTGIKLNTLSQLVDYLERNEMEDGYVVFTGVPETGSFRGKTIHCIAPYEVVKPVSPHSPRFPNAN